MELVRRILLPGIRGAEMEDTGQALFLPSQEQALIATAAEKRRRDFALGRTCAREALEKLGHGHAVIGKAVDGAPLWPAGIVGSITHTKNYAAALAAEARNFSALGVDAERIGGVTQELWPRLMHTAEYDDLKSRAGAGKDIAATLFFSAKEAAFKTGAMKGALHFRDVQVVLKEDGPAGGLAVRLPSGQTLEGRYAVEHDLVLTMVRS
ncbi:MAG TPA: 4'-phosphopantetheinyl transferase superfamily protein [Rhizomicrobium sp.]|nr:4'-phosphopantetheinyl transferase superfamily protein [Rhizomicrobium sp.]